MPSLLPGEMDEGTNVINSIILMVSMLMMIINAFILLTITIIVLLNGNLRQIMEKLLQVEMDKEIEWIN
jgi:hypothetical protein